MHEQSRTGRCRRRRDAVEHRGRRAGRAAHRRLSRSSELAPHATFEETVWLLWNGELPSRSSRAWRAAALPAATLALAARRGVGAASTRWTRCDGRRHALPRGGRSARRILVAQFPTIVAAVLAAAPRRGAARAATRASGMRRTTSTCSTGVEPDAERVRALETYLNTVVDHGLNASTFTARVIISTGSRSRLGGHRRGRRAEGAAARRRAGTGARHGLRDRRRVARRGGAAAEARGGERLMGFGHRVYKVRDPRADVLAAAAERMFARGGDRRSTTLARAVESDGPPPARGVQAGPAAADQRRVLHRAAAPRPRARRRALHADLRRSAASPAGSRTALEQRAANRIIRPQSEYVGPRGRSWTAPAA